MPIFEAQSLHVFSGFLAASMLLTVTGPVYSQQNATADNATKEDAGGIRLSGVVLNPDGTPAPNAKITLHQRHPTTPSNSLPSGKTNADGRFDVVVTGVSDSKLANGVYLRAEKGTMLALKPLGVFGRRAFVLPEDEYEVGLSEAIEETVTVVDMKYRPVPDAKVLVTMGSFLMQEQQVSDRNGVTRFRFPKDNSIRRMLVWKDGLGLEFRSFVARGGENDLKIKQPRPFNPRGETITLTGAITLRIRVVDADDQPVVGVNVYPWLLNPPNQVDTLNLSFFSRSLTVTTDDQGIATFRWIPSWQSKSITFWNSGGAEFTHRRIVVSPRAKAGSDGVHGTLKVQRLVSLSGRAVTRDGQPAAGVEVSIMGSNDERHFDDQLTDQQGRYEFSVPPDILYMITAKEIVDNSIVSVADTITGVAVLPRKPRVADDLVMRPPTMVTGTLTNEAGVPHTGATDRDLSIWTLAKRSARWANRWSVTGGNGQPTNPISLCHN